MNTLELAALEEELLAFLRRKYVCRADERQAAMGLSYLTAEVRDLAKEVARFIDARNRVNCATAQNEVSGETGGDA